MGFYWKPYVPVANRRARAQKKMEKLRKGGKKIEPVEIEGRKIANSFWGKAWCDHLESFSDYDNRLPRGRTYVRNGSVCHLEILPGEIKAYVSGSELYEINIKIEPLKSSIWKDIKGKCSGKIGTMLELLQGKLSDNIMEIVTDRDNGLMPLPKEIKLGCSCPDWAVMCKHVAAVMYGVGSRLDSRPELLFILRGVDPSELVSGDLAIDMAVTGSASAIASDQLSGIFGDDIDFGEIKETKVKSVKKVKLKDLKTTGGKEKAVKVKSEKTAKKAVKNVVKKAVVKAEQETVDLPAKTSKRAVSNNSQSEILTGKAFGQLVKRSKLTASEFAKEMGVSVTSVYNWQKVKGKLKLQESTKARLNKLAEKYK